MDKQLKQRFVNYLLNLMTFWFHIGAAQNGPEARTMPLRQLIKRYQGPFYEDAIFRKLTDSC